MIYVQLSGGLGNQMFQYACGMALANRLSCELVLDTSFLEKDVPNNKYTKRSYELDIFLFSNKISNNAKRITCRLLHFINSYNKLSRYYSLPEIFKKNILLEDSLFIYNERIEKISKNSLLIGNWQNEKYFIESKELILRNFSFVLNLDQINWGIANRILQSNSVSIHIRRGDYVQNRGTNKTHGVCSLDYYKNAIKYIQAKVKDLQFFIFSDDPRWVKENLNIRESYECISNNFGEKCYIDMQLMSLCKHNIIANSTFSWWGAWLNQNPSKIVVAPKRWFANESLNIQTKDLIPQTWARLY